MRWSMKRSDLLIVLAATTLLRPCFFKNRVRTALASSFSAASKVGETTRTLEDPSIPESASEYIINSIMLVFWQKNMLLYVKRI